MTSRQPSYIAQLREKLNRTFNDANFDAFCLDYYPRVYDTFSRGMQKDEKVTQLLDHCRRETNGLDRLSKMVDQYKISNKSRKKQPLTERQDKNWRVVIWSIIVLIVSILLIIILPNIFIDQQSPIEKPTSVVNTNTPPPVVALPTKTPSPIREPTFTRRPTYTSTPSPTMPPPTIPPTASPTMPPTPTNTLIPTIPSPTDTPIPTIPPPTMPPPPTISPPSNTPVPPLGKGSVMTSTKDGMIRLYVPAGDFEMGSGDDDPYVNDKDKTTDETPRHTVYLDAFWIDLTEVTNAMFGRFVEETGHETEAEKEGSGYVCPPGEVCSYIDGANWRHPQGPESNIIGLSNHPVVQVSWNDANAYCQWAGRRLPTEAEWEKAAGGTDGRKWPWGNETPNKNLANFHNPKRTEPVGSYSAGVSPYGVFDMTGNVSEWVNDNYDKDYYRSSPKENPQGPELSEDKVARGGDFWASAKFTRVRFRNHSEASFRDEDWGFRCALSAE